MGHLPWGVGIFILGILLFGVPTAVGGCFCSGGTNPWNRRCSLPFLWVSGQMLLWAGFQLVCVPFILLKGTFPYVVYCYGGLTGVLALWGLLTLWRGHTASRDRKRGFRLLEGGAAAKGNAGGKPGRGLVRPAAAVGALLLFQLVQSVRLTYADGDDAYYVAVSTITENADTMYQKLPYTGGATELDVRHGLAPFPVWISFLARVSGLPPVGVAHVALPLMLIPMTYGIYYLLAGELFPGNPKKKLSFLLVTELLVLFGDYSYYTAERFMLARSRQGKAALGSVILPMLFWLLLLLMKRIQEDKKCAPAYWGLVTAVLTAGCLCSTVGTFLLCLLMGVAGICTAAVYHRWKFLVPMALCCLPCVCFAVLYLFAQ